jgi:hypothetical protein
MPITSQLVKDFYGVACTKYGATITSKSNSDFMKLIGSFLDGIGVLDKELFMKQYTTTVGTSIYTPYEIGVDGGPNGYDLWDQVKVLVHELTHVVQYKTYPVKFMVLYLASPSDRASYEAEALAADLQLYYWMYRSGYDIQQRVKTLLNYGLKQEHCDYVAQYLNVHNDIFAQGGSSSEIATWAASWLDDHGARL